MNYRELIASSLMALRSNLMRTGLTMLGIVIGITSVILIISLGEGATKVITNEIASFGTNMIMVLPGSFADGSFATTKTLTPDDADTILKQGSSLNVAAVSPLVSKSGVIAGNGESLSTSIYGIGESYADMQTVAMSQGEFISEDHVKGISRVIVLGPDVAKDIFGEGAEPVGKSVKIDNRSFRVIGVAAPKDSIDRPPPNEVAYVPYTTMMKTMLGQNYLQGILVEGSDPKIVDQTMENISALLRDRHDISDPAHDDFSMQSAKDLLSTLDTITGLLTALLAGIAGISLLVGGIGIMNIMLVTVTERTKEIGLLKAIGAKRRDILTQFLIESVMLTLTGGIIGMTLGILLAFGITKLANIPFIIKPSSILLSVGISSIVGIVFGLYPARRAAKLSPIDALRYE